MEPDISDPFLTNLECVLAPEVFELLQCISGNSNCSTATLITQNLDTLFRNDNYSGLWADYVTFAVVLTLMNGSDHQSIWDMATLLHHGFSALFHAFPVDSTDDIDLEEYYASSYVDDVATPLLLDIRTRFWTQYAVTACEVHRLLQHVSPADRRMYEQFALPLIHTAGQQPRGAERRAECDTGRSVW